MSAYFLVVSHAAVDVSGIRETRVGLTDYDTIRDATLTCAHVEPKTKKWKKKNKKVKKNPDMLRSIGKLNSPGNPWCQF